MLTTMEWNLFARFSRLLCCTSGFVVFIIFPICFDKISGYTLKQPEIVVQSDSPQSDSPP